MSGKPASFSPARAASMSWRPIPPSASARGRITAIGRFCRTPALTCSSMALPETLSVAQARRVTLAAQGFADPRPGGATDLRHLRRVLRRVHLIQMDSVNVLQRAHFMPLYSRLGPYPVGLLERAAYRNPRELFEFWGHEASLITVDLQPLFRWRMERAKEYAWGGMVRIFTQQPELVERVLADVRDRGPL